MFQIWLFFGRCQEVGGGGEGEEGEPPTEFSKRLAWQDLNLGGGVQLSDKK